MAIPQQFIPKFLAKYYFTTFFLRAQAAKKIQKSKHKIIDKCYTWVYNIFAKESPLSSPLAEYGA